MSAGNVAGLVRKHPDDLIGRLRVQQSTSIYEDAAAIGDKGVERAVIDDDDLNVLLCEAGNPQDGLGIFLEQLLDFRIADDRRTGLRPDRNCDERERGHNSNHPRRWRRPVHPATSARPDHACWACGIFWRNLAVAPNMSMRPGSRLIAGFRPREMFV